MTIFSVSLAADPQNSEIKNAASKPKRHSNRHRQRRH
jgi:hypothetical protein